MNPIKTTLHDSTMEQEEEKAGKLCEYLIAELKNPFKEPRASELLVGMEWSNIDQTKAKVFTQENQHVFDMVHREIVKIENEKKFNVFL